MRGVLRKASAWLLALSLVDGLMLPFVAKPALVDPDGACGPVLVLAHSIQHFETPLAAETGHCVLCHLWNAMSSASTSACADFTPPSGVVTAPGPIARDRIQLRQIDDASPRGPPASA